MANWVKFEDDTFIDVERFTRVVIFDKEGEVETFYGRVADNGLMIEAYDRWTGGLGRALISYFRNRVQAFDITPLGKEADIEQRER